MRSSLVRDVGEFGLIAALEAALPEAARAGGALEVGIGDDCAVWQPPKGSAVVVTTDSLVEGVHFRLEWTDWERLGHKTLAANLSDIASMGATPAIAVVTLALRGSERLADLEALYRGMGALAVSSGTRIAGGDIVASPTVLALHLTLLATAHAGTVLKRSGARPGDLLGVSGTLGASAAGLRLLQAGGMNARRRAATAELLIEAHLRPQPRLPLGKVLLEQGASACMDLSDGLFGDLPKLLTASGMRGRIREQDIPVAAAVRALFPAEWLHLATRGGEDYELLFTISPGKWGALEAAAKDVGSTVTAIGEILPPEEDVPQMVMVSNGVERPVRSGAFDHFAG